MTGSALYDAVAFDCSRRLTLAYSSSFGLASRLFSQSIRPHIYAIYGMVRVADEIVDTHEGSDRHEQLTDFHADIIACLQSGYSTNPIIHAFGVSARRYAIGADLIDPFFASMAADLTAARFTQNEYDEYIYGSAEVVGLMCLKVFYADDLAGYEAAVPGARALGRAYQKVNFLRDFAADFEQRGRIYFPDIEMASWNDAAKDAVVASIDKDFADAHAALFALPRGARTSVYLSYLYYNALLKRLKTMSAQDILQSRAHVPGAVKIGLLIVAPLGARLR